MFQEMEILLEQSLSTLAFCFYNMFFVGSIRSLHSGLTIKVPFDSFKMEISSVFEVARKTSRLYHNQKLYGAYN
jgi:hypothetical protein